VIKTLGTRRGVRLSVQRAARAVPNVLITAEGMAAKVSIMKPGPC
jgi:hypothetical protein